MIKKLLTAIFIFLCLESFIYADESEGENQNNDSANFFKIENIGELSGNLIGFYVFEKLPLYGHYEFINTALQYYQIENVDTVTVDLIVPFSNTFNRKEGKDADGWTGTGEYYVAILNMSDDFIYWPKIKDTYIFMDNNNTPVKVSFAGTLTTLDFKDFKKATEFYSMEIYSLYEDDLLVEYKEDPIYTDDYYFENDLLFDVLYNGDITLLDTVIEPKKLIPFNYDELQLLRYMIFAKNGYRFRSDYLKVYFSRFSWYNGAKSFVQLKMTAIDWQNIRIIHDFEKKFAVNNKKSNFGERFSFTGKIVRIDDKNWPKRHFKKIAIDGEITVFCNPLRFDIKRTEIAKTKIENNQFQIELKEVPPDLFDLWNRKIDTGVNGDGLISSDPDLKIAIPDFVLTGTYIDLYGIEQSFYNSTEILETGKSGYDFYYYMYSDKDAVIYGAPEGDPGYSNGLAFKYGIENIYERYKRIYSVYLKKGWNKIKYSITYNGKYIIQKTESSSESSGFYGLGISWDD